MDHAVAVVNPQSQNGELGRRWPEVSATLRRAIGDFETAMTAGPGHASRLARVAIERGATLVIAVGGDGTIHEVANGFFDDSGAPAPGQAALGLLPYGTGGDYRKSIRVPKDLGAAARVLAHGARRQVDAGLLEYAEGGRGGPRARRVFVNIASFGIGGLVDRIVNESSKALGGTLSFMIGTARATWRYRNQRVRLVFDGDEKHALETTINNVAVANGRYFGGGMHIAPTARIDDGLFDIVTIGDVSTGALMRDFLRVYRGAHLTLPSVSHRRASRVDAAPAFRGDEVLLDVDGEALGALPATFTLLPGALPVVVPAEARHA